MRILVVDDSKTISMMVLDMLKTNKIDAKAAYNGEEAVSMLKKGETFDMILLDWNMPTLDGPGFLEKVRKDNIKCPPVCMMTTENAPDKINKAIELGAVEYIMKPFTFDILISKIEMVQSAS